MQSSQLSGELCAMRLIRTFGDFNISPNKPGCFRKPSKIAVSRYNGHIAVVDTVYATVQVGNYSVIKFYNGLTCVQN